MSDLAGALAWLFLFLYAALFVHLVVLYAKRAIDYKSRFTVLTLHILVRVASQAVGVAFAYVGYSNTGLLVAYFILGAEGYFTLVLCSYRFLISWQQDHFLSGESWLEPRVPKGTPLWKKLLGSFVVVTPGEKPRPMAFMHQLLIAANTMIVVGGSLLSGGSNSTADFGKDEGNVRTARILRTAGQAIFLAINFVLLGAITHTMHQERKERPSGQEKKFFVHPTLILLLLAWPLLIVRGFYGLLNSYIDAFNYFIPGNYTADGLTREFIVFEYVLGTLMEWVSCALLMATWWTERWTADQNQAQVENRDNHTHDHSDKAAV
ncbi:hypothetical protein HGRIS_004064 [Hohenbuehelia grisea]|uniref:Uncharacterized protein n=1 Tax=Hohenbuehelia grisea TaxID=104357 RepID=A0ABR3JHJ7_9AGAR